jgi:hypothetical protein
MQLCHERNVGQELGAKRTSLLEEPKEEDSSKGDVDDDVPICKLLKKPLASLEQASEKIHMEGAIMSTVVLFEEPLDAGREMEDDDDNDVPIYKLILITSQKERKKDICKTYKLSFVKNKKWPSYVRFLLPAS